MNRDYIPILEKMFDLDFDKDIIDIVEELGEEIKKEKDLKVEVRQCEEDKVIDISYSLEEDSRVTALALIAGLPNEEFDRAEMVYKMEVEEYEDDYGYILEGSSVGGALAKYAGILSESYVDSYKVITYNSLGIEGLLQFRGNEFFGL